MAYLISKHLPGHESVPDEVHNLLYLMRQPDCFKLTEAIQYHPCLVPLENRGHLFLKEYQYTVDILRKIEPLNFRYVMTQLVYPRHWKIIAESNPYVQAVIERYEYTVSCFVYFGTKLTWRTQICLLNCNSVLLPYFHPFSHPGD